MSAVTETPTITETAKAFFETCETGKGWEGCSAYGHPNASFSAQANGPSERDHQRQEVLRKV